MKYFYPLETFNYIGRIRINGGKVSYNSLNLGLLFIPMKITIV